MRCTATLTTATVEPCPEDDNCPDGLMHFWGDDGKQHVTHHTLECVDSDCETKHRNDYYGKTLWRDDTPGASPHAEPLVTDDEVEAACIALRESGMSVPDKYLRRALEAAALVRKEAQA